MNILLAAFYTPGIRAIEYLIQRGFQPQQIRLITHDLPQNETLTAFASCHAIETKTFSIKSADAHNWVKEFHPHAIFSLYFRDIIPRRILDIPAFGAVNLHPSLLPRYRGAFSAPHVILNGERHTGFSYHYMVADVDAGNIILQRKVPVREDDTAYSLYHRLVIEGMTAFDEAFRLVAEKRFVGRKQAGEPTYYPRRVPNDGYIDPSWSREQVGRFIRAMYFPPFKGAAIKLTDGQEREIASLADYDALVRDRQVII